MIQVATMIMIRWTIYLPITLTRKVVGQRTKVKSMAPFIRKYRSAWTGTCAKHKLTTRSKNAHQRSRTSITVATTTNNVIRIERK